METIRGIRLNNPGNIETGASWQGLMPPEQMTSDQKKEKRFCVFSSPAYGIRAIARTLITYQDQRKAGDGSRIDTVREVIERWAPASENDVDAYAGHVRKLLNVQPGDIIDVHDYDTLRGLVIGIIKHECAGYEYPDAVVDKGLVLAGVERTSPSLKGSRTVQGGQVAAGSLTGASAIDMVTENLDVAKDGLSTVMYYSEIAKWAFIALTFIGLGVMLYARWDDFRKLVR